MFGVPYQYTLSRILRARLDYLQVGGREYVWWLTVRLNSACLGINPIVNEDMY